MHPELKYILLLKKNTLFPFSCYIIPLANFIKKLERFNKPENSSIESNYLTQL